MNERIINALVGLAGVTIVRMEVPCCGGLEMAAPKSDSGQREIPSLAGRHHID